MVFKPKSKIDKIALSLGRHSKSIDICPISVNSSFENYKTNLETPSHYFMSREQSFISKISHCITNDTFRFR